MNRLELQALADLREQEAKKLLENELYSGAYYLAGYAIECGLKACIAKNTVPDSFPDKKFAGDVHTHKLVSLLKLSGLELEFNDDANMHRSLGINWNLVREWNEVARYKEWEKLEAIEMVEAVSHPYEGVLQWIRQYW